MADDALSAFVARPESTLPDVSSFDPSVLAPEARVAALAVWRRRLENESGSVALARNLATAAVEVGVSHWLPSIARLESDEASHVELCAAVLRRLGSPARVTETVAPMPDGTAPERLARLVVTGLAVCESVSAARFAEVRRHTDLDVPRQCIELFLRDEIRHSELGFALFPEAFALLGAGAHAFVGRELRETFRHLDMVVGLDAERRGVELERRLQPRGNPGVVEPALDALAFRESVPGVVERFEQLGVAARAAWEHRWHAAS